MREVVEMKAASAGSGEELIDDDDDQEMETGFEASGKDVTNDEKDVTANEMCHLVNIKMHLTKFIITVQHVTWKH